jgi:PAS domain S-box-containing protein
MTALTLASTRDVFPPFFIPGVGSTPLDQAVLGTAIAFWALASILLLSFYRQVRIEFHFWYGLALALTAVGLVGVYLQKDTGSLLNWAGRFAQQLGGVYFWAAVWLMLREGQVKGIALETQVASLFRHSEANYRALIENATDAIIAVDEHQHVLLWNPAAERIFGYRRAETLGAPLLEMIFAAESLDHIRREWDAWGEDAPGEPPVRATELVARRRNGELITVEYTVSARGKGRNRMVTLILRDITERKQAEELAERREREFRTLAENSPDLIDRLDVQLRHLYVNPAASRAFGLPAAAFVGKTSEELGMPPELVQQWGQKIQAVFATGQPGGMEYEMATPSGKRTFESRLVPELAPDRSVQSVLAISRDITDRKRAEENIRMLGQELESQAGQLEEMNVHLEEALSKEQTARAAAEEGRRILESLMDYAPEGIVITSGPRGNTRRVSRFGREMLGSRLDELIGLPDERARGKPSAAELGMLTPIDFGDLLARALDKGELSNDQELLLLEPDGRWRTLLTSAGPIRDMRGKITGAVLIWREITARKETEAQVEKLNRTLERRAVELEVANRELESFSYSVSHDLRTPLANIQGFAGLLLTDYVDQLQPDSRRMVELIRENSLEMTQLIEALLAFSRFIRQPLRKQEVEIASLVGQALEDLRDQQQGRRVEIIFGKLPPARADPVLLKQVLINLLSNALKFTRARAVARIEIGSTPSEEGELLYWVRDNGVGFDMDQAEKLFGVFQRLHSEDYEGVGVGLAIVERIIHRHGGRVFASGEVDEGATFYFTLPE